MKKEISCTCDECKAMCRRPCWPTPEEAQHLINAGYGSRLMQDYWCKKNGDIYILSPAVSGYENSFAPFWPTGKCTFQDDNGLCQLHDLGYKPLEGRKALCKDRTPKKLHEKVAKMWDNPEAQELVRRWNEAR